jgi:hypothetical protein
MEHVAVEPARIVELDVSSQSREARVDVSTEAPDPFVAS